MDETVLLLLVAVGFSGGSISTVFVWRVGSASLARVLKMYI